MARELGYGFGETASMHVKPRLRVPARTEASRGRRPRSGIIGHRMDPERYYLDLAAAFVHGRCPELRHAGLSAAELVERGRAAGLRLHEWKRNDTLPRVAKVLGILRGLGHMIAVARVATTDEGPAKEQRS